MLITFGQFGANWWHWSQKVAFLVQSAVARKWRNPQCALDANLSDDYPFNPLLTPSDAKTKKCASWTIVQGSMPLTTSFHGQPGLNRKHLQAFHTHTHHVAA